jgi:septal ring factor EnvC (AmiA/AmiB activator)
MHAAALLPCHSCMPTPTPCLLNPPTPTPTAHKQLTSDSGEAKRWGAEAGSLKQELLQASATLDRTRQELADSREQLRQAQTDGSKTALALEGQVAELTQQLMVRWVVLLCG